MSTIRSSALVSSAAQYLMFLLSFLKIAVVSRLLTPDDIGAFTLASSVIFLAQFLRVYGTWDYIVSQKDLTEEKLRLCFTLVVVMAVVITTTYLLSARPLARFFDAPVLPLLIWVMAPSFLILPVGTVALALMNREMDFVTLSKIRIAATLVDAGLVIAMVVAGYGVISLAWGYTAGNVISTLLVIRYSHRALVYPLRFRGMAEILRFGTLSAAGTFLSAVGVSGPALVVGHGYNPAAVAIFGRGQTLITFFRQGLEFATRPVTMAYFAQRSGMAPAEIGTSYLRITAIMSGVAWPVYVSLYFGAPTLIPLLLGDQWYDSIPILQALSVGGVLSFYAVTGISLLEGHGLVGKRLVFNLITQGVRLAMLLVALPYGLEVFAWTLAATHVVSFVLISLFLRAETHLHLRATLWSMRKSVVLGVVLVALDLALFTWVFPDPYLSFAEFSLFALVSFMIWLACLRLLNHPVWQEGTAFFERRRLRAG